RSIHAAEGQAGVADPHVAAQTTRQPDGVWQRQLRDAEIRAIGVRQRVGRLARGWRKAKDGTDQAQSRERVAEEADHLTAPALTVHTWPEPKRLPASGSSPMYRVPVDWS